MRFLHISDTHFLRDYSKVTDGFHDAFQLMMNPIDQLKEILATLDEEYDFVIHSGDMVHTRDLAGINTSNECKEYEDIRGEYIALKKELQSIFPDKPFLLTPGNHDNKMALKEVFCPNEDSALDLVYYKIIGEVLIISFDSTSEAPSGAVTKETCKRIQEILNNNPEKQAILFTHHHLLKKQFEMSAAKVDNLFFEILSSKQVMGVITGHTHHTYKSEMNGVDYFTGASLSFVVDNEHGNLNIYECAGVQVCTINPKGMTVRNYSSEKRKIGVLSV